MNSLWIEKREMRPFQVKLDLGKLKIKLLKKIIIKSLKKRKDYMKYSPEECYKIGRYASDHGPIYMSITNIFRKKDGLELANAKQKGKVSSASLVLKQQEQCKTDRSSPS